MQNQYQGIPHQGLATAEHPSKTEDALVGIQNTLEDLERNFEMLRQQLTPVLSPTQEVQSDRAQNHTQPNVVVSSAVVEKLHGYRNRIERLHQEVSRIRDLLEV